MQPLVRAREDGAAEHHGGGQKQGGDDPDEDHEASRTALIAHPHSSTQGFGQVGGEDGDQEREGSGSVQQRDAEGHVLGDTIERHGGKDGEPRDTSSRSLDVTVEKLVRSYKSRGADQEPDPRELRAPCVERLLEEIEGEGGD